MIIIESFIRLTSNTLAGSLIKKGIFLLFTEPTLRQLINIAQLPLTLLTPTRPQINNLPPITINTLLPSQIKHPPGTIEAILTKIDCERRLYGTCGEIPLAGLGEEDLFVLGLG